MAGNHATALVVDDEESIRYALANELRNLELEVTTASSAQEAFALVDRDRPFDLIMLDVRMPGVNGLEALRRLRRELPGACIIMLSAVVDSDIAAEAIRLGADDYLTKPWSPEELKLRLEQAMSRRAATGAADSSSGDPKIDAAGEVDVASVTKDLIAQQMTAYERITAEQSEREAKDRSSGWWFWRKKK